MGSLLHPVGSLPPGAYWFRRGVFAVVVLLLAGGGWFVLSGGGSGSPAASPSITPLTTPSSTPVVTSSTTPSSTPSPTVSHSPTASSTPVAVPLCPDSAIQVEASTDAGTYAAGEKPKLTVTVTNTGKVACKRDIGRAAMGLVVSTGTTRVWSSDDCAPGGQAAVNTLKPGQVFSSTVLWNRTSSKQGCPSAQPAALTGTYTLVARNITLKSGPVTFVLH